MSEQAHLQLGQGAQRDFHIARAAEDLFEIIRTQSGPTRDWPIDIAIDDELVAVRFLAKLNRLGEAIDPSRKRIFTGQLGK